MLFVLFLFAIVVCDDIVINTGDIGITWEGGGDEANNCPKFRFELYKNDQPTEKYIEMTWVVLAEVDAEGETARVEYQAYGIDEPKHVDELKDDFTAEETDVPGGKNVRMVGSLAFVKEMIDTYCSDNSIPPTYCVSQVYPLVTEAMGGNDKWLTTQLVADHFLATTGDLEIKYGSKTVTVSPAGNHLALTLRFTGYGIGDLPTIEEDPDFEIDGETYHQVSAISQYGRFDMNFIDVAAVGPVGSETEAKTFGDVTIEVDNQIDPNGYVDVTIHFPVCPNMDDCEIEYDPSFNVKASANMFGFGLLLLIVVFIALF